MIGNIQGIASGTPVPISGTVTVTETRPATGTVTSVVAAAVSTTLLAGNVVRRGAMIYNDSAALLYVKLAATASLTSFTAQVGPGGQYSLPSPVYTGIIDGIWDAAVGNARVTELT